MPFIGVQVDFPLNITSMTLGSCAPLNISKPNNTGFALIPTPATNGCSVGRTCDASPTWQAQMWQQH
jgi:hypothetical protein